MWYCIIGKIGIKEDLFDDDVMVIGISVVVKNCEKNVQYKLTVQLMHYLYLKYSTLQYNTVQAVVLIFGSESFRIRKTNSYIVVSPIYCSTVVYVLYVVGIFLTVKRKAKLPTL